MNDLKCNDMNQYQIDLNQLGKIVNKGFKKLIGNGFGYFPIQKLAKILPNKSSVVISPVISPK